MTVQVTALQSKHYFRTETGISSIHSTFFHGYGSRSGKKYPAGECAYSTNDVRDSLHIVRSGKVIPPITSPAASLVFTAAVVEAVQEVPHCEFLETTLAKVVGKWISKGDMSFYKKALTRKWAEDEDGYLDHLPSAEELLLRAPTMMEFIVPKLIDVAREFSDLKTIRFYLGEHPYGDEKDFALSRSLMEKYPVVRLASVSLFRSDIFQRIAHFINCDFYNVCTRDVS